MQKISLFLFSNKINFRLKSQEQISFTKVTMSTQTMFSFPPIDYKSSATFYNQRVSVLGAVNKLKEMENKVIQVGNRGMVQKRINEALMARQYGKEKSSANKQAIRRSVDMDKSLRENSITQRIRQQSNLHSLAQQFRKNKLKLRQQLKSAHKLNNSQIYSHAVTQRSKNQRLIKQFKEREMLLKRENRLRIEEGEERSREKVRGFMEGKAGEIKRWREQEVGELQRKIMMRSRYLQTASNNKDKAVSQNRSSIQNSSVVSEIENNGSHSSLLARSNKNSISFSLNKVQTTNNTNSTTPQS